MWELFLFGAAAVLAVGVLFNPRSAIVWLGAIGAMWEAHWLVAVLVQRTLASGIPDRAFFVAASTVALLFWAWQWHQKKPQVKIRGGLMAEAIMAILLVAVLASAHLVVTNNGFSGGEWITSGFYNGDTVTFATLVERSRATNGLVTTNPFAGNGPLEYPTLLHAAVADFLALIEVSGSWLHFLPTLTSIQVLFTIPLFFLLWEMAGTRPDSLFGASWQARLGSRLAQALVVAYVLAISWDNYIYPQSHFFLTALYLLLVAVWLRAQQEKGRRQLVYIVVGSLIALVLLRSNAVTGTAAVGVTMVWLALQLFDRARSIAHRTAYAGGIIAWLALYLLYTPGHNSFGLPGISYTAAHDILPFSALVLALLGASIYSRQSVFLSAVSAALSCLAVATYLFSTRDIVIDNAARFFYHAALAGFPLLFVPLMDGYQYLQVKLRIHRRPLAEVTVNWGIVGAAAFVFALPAAASVLHSFDDLLFKDTLVVPAASLDAMAWIAAETPPEAVFLASPARPWAIPLFTGRALLRTHYWLSPEDAVAQEVDAAFAGDQAAQARALLAADYLVLTSREIPQWRTLPEKKVYQNSHTVIYQLP